MMHRYEGCTLLVDGLARRNIYELRTTKREILTGMPMGWDEK